MWGDYMLGTPIWSNVAIPEIVTALSAIAWLWMINMMQYQGKLEMLGEASESAEWLSQVEKLKNIPNVLRDDVNYPHSTYEFTIKDIETNKDWSFNLGEDVEADHEYDVTIPVAIRYSNGNVNFGKMELKFYINETW